MKRFMKVLLIVISVLAVASCNKTKVSKEDSMVMAIKRTIQSLDVHDTTQTTTLSVGRFYVETLYTFNENMELIPKLATSYEMSADSRVYRFHLREGVKFQDGADFNADAVKKSFERLGTGNYKKSTVLMHLVKEINVIDDYTIDFVLKAPYASLVNKIAHPSQAIYSPNVVGKYSKAEFTKHIIGTGPFKIVSYQTGGSLELERFDGYWGEKAGVKKFVIKPVSEPATVVAMLKSGQAQYAEIISGELAKTVESDKKLEVLRMDTIIESQAYFNTKSKTFADKRVRKAINYLVNKKDYVKVVRSGDAEVANSVYPLQLEAAKVQKVYDYDMDKGLSLLKGAGFDFNTEIQLVSTSTPSGKKKVIFLQQQLQKAGLKTKIISFENAVYTSSVLNLPSSTPYIAFYAWSSSTADADWAIRPLLSKGEASNIGRYDNPTLDSMLNKATALADKQERYKLLDESQDIIWDDAPALFLVTWKSVTAKAKNVEGITYIPDGSFAPNSPRYVK